MADTLGDCGDAFFGPGILRPDCRGGFDFTVLFENSILTILPAGVFLLLAPLRAQHLLAAPVRVKQTSMYSAKILASVLYSTAELAALIVATTNASTRAPTMIAASVLSFVASLGIAYLSRLEHIKSIRPSFLITVFLSVTILLDAASIRTQWLAGTNVPLAAVMVVELAFKLILLILETVEKRQDLVSQEKADLPSTESTSGPFSRGLFFWLNSLLRTGFSTLLTPEALPRVYERLDSSRLSAEFQTAWNKKNPDDKYALVKATVSALKRDILAIYPARLLLLALRVSQPFLIGRAVRFLEAPVDQVSNSAGYGLIGAFALVYIGAAIANGWYQHLTYRVMTMVRGGLISLLYEKMIRSRASTISESGAMALMGTDVENIAETAESLFVQTWASVIQLSIAVWLLAMQLGAVCVVPIIIAVLCTFLSVRAGKYTSKRQKTWFEATQERINFTTEILGNMKSVKMLGLTEKMTDTITKMRNHEVALSKSFRRIMSFNICLVNMPEGITQLLTFATFAIVAQIQGSGRLSVSQAITSLAILDLLGVPLSNLLWGIPRCYSALSCFFRIQDFLKEGAWVDLRYIQESSGRKQNGSRQSSIISLPIRSGEIALTKVQPAVRSSDKTVPAEVDIHNGDFGYSASSSGIVVHNASVHVKNNLTLIVGPVGCGKSTFLKGVVGEVVTRAGAVSVTSAEIAYCEQTPWVINGTIRDNIVAESDYDPEWYAQVLYACDLDADLQSLSKGDLTVVGSKGVKLSGGQKQRLAIARAVFSRKSIQIYDDVFSGLDFKTEEAVFTRVFGREGLLQQTSVCAIVATHAVRHLEKADFIIALGADGTIVQQGTFADLAKLTGYVQSLSANRQDAKATENAESQEPAKDLREAIEEEVAEAGDRATQVTDWKIYAYYAKALGWFGLSVFLAFTTVNSGLAAFQLIWITWWTASNSDNLGYWLGVFGALTAINQISLGLAIFWSFVVVIPTASKNLHSVVLSAAMRAPMSLFSKTQTGMLINRFSQDMRLVDLTLPRTVIVVFFQACGCIALTILAIVAVGYFAISIPFVLVILVLVQRFYLRTSRQIRLLEIEEKAPLFSHFIESLHGLITIRAFGWSNQYLHKTFKLLNASQKPFYLLLCIQRWLELVLDLVVACLTIFLVGLSVGLRDSVNPGLLGVALVSMTNLAHAMSDFVNNWTLLETSLGAVARIKTFAEDTPNENLPIETTDPGPHWPAEGALQFDNVSVSYNLSAGPVLKNISMTIGPGQKIGIVGRTGSGKSSLILSLLRLADISGGRVLIDGVDITTIPRRILRGRLSCLTQEPFLYTASVRDNADPTGAAADADIFKALERVGIWKAVAERRREAEVDVAGASANPLDAVMDENFLSHGQRQLFCLARALLKKSTVLILDEPTSSVDEQTDAQMQQVIRSEFKHCTILMIAHRLNSLRDFDRIAVIDKGHLIRFETPTTYFQEPPEDIASSLPISSSSRMELS